jgi:hypothetical protein
MMNVPSEFAVGDPTVFPSTLMLMLAPPLALPVTLLPHATGCSMQGVVDAF